MTPSVKKSKLLELEIVRAVAIVAVLIIHATASATVELPAGSGSQALYAAVNKLSQFAVPVFILISGLVLFYRYNGDWSRRQSIQFYTKRIKQVVVPYVIWSLFYYLFEQWIYMKQQLHWDWAEFGNLLWTANASYHLYFMLIIVQFYLLFPLMMWLCDALPWFRRSLIWIGLLVQALFICYTIWIHPVENFASLCVNYFSMFTLGGWIGLHYDAFIQWLGRSKRWVFAFFVLLGLMLVANLLHGHIPWQLYTIWFELLYFSYAAFACMSFIWIGRLLMDKKPRAARAILHLGAASFGIYLVHPAVMTGWSTLVPNESGGMLKYHAYTAATLLLSLFISWLFVYLYRQVAKHKPKAVPKSVGA